uniref:Uncharacterized protein n=1 Tax=Caenorhabditis japonica TaxID=281687 RepID=A0A8R1I089_CAEJA
MVRTRNPREPTPLVLMNPELRVRQLRYAANIEATQMVPLHRYYEVLLDLSAMGLEYLKALKLERAFIIFKRIEYFIFHRLKDHPGAQTFRSEAKGKIMGRLPMIMYVAQQIIVEFIMPVYERQAAYFRYEELQRRLKILNPTAWNAIISEATKRRAEFYSEAESISSRFGVELSNFLPYEVTPDDHHPSNYPPRTFPAKTLLERSDEDIAAQTALSVAINSMNTTAETIVSNQPLESLVQNVNEMMNNALLNFFTSRQAQAARFPHASFPGANAPEPSSDQLAEVNHQHTETSPPFVLHAPQPGMDRETRSYSPRVDHMYRISSNITGDREHATNGLEKRNVYEHNPTHSLETYISLLCMTFDANSTLATGFRIHQVAHRHAPSPSTAGFMLHLQRIQNDVESTASRSLTLLDASNRTILIPDPDPGRPSNTPPLVNEHQEPNTWGIWAKRGTACGPGGVGSLGVLSDLERAREVLDAVPPMSTILKD